MRGSTAPGHVWPPSTRQRPTRATATARRWTGRQDRATRRHDVRTDRPGRWSAVHRRRAARRAGRRSARSSGPRTALPRPPPGRSSPLRCRWCTTAGLGRRRERGRAPRTPRSVRRAPRAPASDRIPSAQSPSASTATLERPRRAARPVRTTRRRGSRRTSLGRLQGEDLLRRPLPADDRRIPCRS